MPQRPSSLNPQVSPALDAVVMRALEKEPGNRFQSADAFIAALDQAMAATRSGRDTAAYAALPPVVAIPEEDEEDKDGNRKWLWIGLAIAAIIGVLIGLALTRNTDTTVPKVTDNALNVAITLLEQDGFSVGEIKRVEREVAPNTVLEQDPAPGNAEEDCSFLTFFCSKPQVDLTVSAGPGSSESPGTSNLPVDEATKKLKKPGSRRKSKTPPPPRSMKTLVIYSEPRGGSTATNGSTVTLFVSSGPKLVSVPAVVGAQRAEAVERLRARGFVPAVSEEKATSRSARSSASRPRRGNSEPGLDGRNRRLQRRRSKRKSRT